MQTLEAGKHVTPTVAHCVWLPAPRGGRIFPWGGPAEKPSPTVAELVACKPLGQARKLRGPQANGNFGAPLGFTLLELLLVVAIMAVAAAGVSFSLPDSGQTQLEREALRLAALLESGRSRSLTSGVPVRWQATASGFVFEGLAAGDLPNAWLTDDVGAQGAASLLLGPEPIIGPQSVRLVSTRQPGRSVNVMTDGVRPFSVQADGVPAGAP